MKLVATKDFTYANRPLKVGDRFHATSVEDARLLKGWGKAMECIDDEEEEGTGKINSQTKRRYRRRDMRAER
jgi:hypothetical protein